MSIGIITFYKPLSKHSELIFELSKREIIEKYRGSFIGKIWLVINPLIMLTIYTVVFSGIFKAKWGSVITGNDTTLYGLNLFAGLIVFNISAETITSSPTLIVNNPNYVKKVVFPIEVLGCVKVISAMHTALISLVTLTIARLVLTGSFNMTVIITPIIWIGLALFCLGMSWILSSVTVIVRDIINIVGPVVSISMFLSPVFYPPEALPNSLKWISNMNPLTIFIQETRRLAIDGQMINISSIIITTSVALIWCEVCYRVLEKMKPIFGDLV